MADAPERGETGARAARLGGSLRTRGRVSMKPTRRVVAGLSGAAVLLIGAGIAAIVFDAGLSGGIGTATSGPGTTMPIPSSPGISTTGVSVSPVPSGSSTTGSPVPSASIIPSPTPGPSAHPVGFALQGTALVYDAADGSVLPVPPIDGLQVQVQNGKAIYSALSSNRYGLASGAFAGEFVPSVATGQVDGSSALTGGLVLVGPVVARLIADDLAAIKSASDRWVVALPVDIRQATGSIVQVSFDQFGQIGASNAPRVYVRFGGALPVVETIPANAGYHVLVEGLEATAWQVIDPTRLGLATDSIDVDHVMNELVVYGNGTPSLNGDTIRRDIHHDGRVAVGTPMIAATSGVSVSLAVSGSHRDLGPDKILTVGDVPVFVASS